ncbi:TRANSPARENT TESTA protein 12 [Spatholobus suberectus]|nr:TRANSPARENT TESTA protein 12 [Spatholobus suberectus]
MVTAILVLLTGNMKNAQVSIDALTIWKRLAYIFAQDPDVAEAVGDLSPLLAVSMLLNSVQPVLSGNLYNFPLSRTIITTLMFSAANVYTKKDLVLQTTMEGLVVAMSLIGNSKDIDAFIRE